MYIVALVGKTLLEHMKINELQNNIDSYIEQFKKYNMTCKVIIFTWEDENIYIPLKTLKNCEIVFYKEKDMNYIINNFSDIKHKNPNSPRKKDILINNLHKDSIQLNLQLGGSFISICHMWCLKKYCINYLKKYENAYVFLIRLDTIVDFGDINNWINDSYNANFQHLSRGKPRNWEYNPVSDHIGGAYYKTHKLIYDISEKELSQSMSEVYSAENLLFYHINKNKINIIKHKLDLSKSYVISHHNHPRI